jgi:4-diphosphocytidyl-2-C-methyl-D-erythritol kinase
MLLTRRLAKRESGLSRGAPEFFYALLMRLPSFAKINLFLRVLGKRPDGFHEVSTFILPLELADEMTFEPRSDGRIEVTCSHPSLPTDRRNLVRRAADLLKERHAPKQGAHIHLEKRVPIGAGLGGGSSNGSTALVGLNRLWNLNLPAETLEALAAEFGSDTAIFVRCRPALCEGRGEKLTLLDFPVRLPVFLLNFGFGSATAWAYRHLRPGAAQKDPFDPQALVRQAVAHADSAADGRVLQEVLQNDLEKPVFGKFPILRMAREFLLQQPQVMGAMMCGSGSTMMAVTRTLEDAARLQEPVRRRFGPAVWTWNGWTCGQKTDV